MSGVWTMFQSVPTAYRTRATPCPFAWPPTVEVFGLSTPDEDDGEDPAAELDVVPRPVAAATAGAHAAGGAEGRGR